MNETTKCACGDIYPADSFGAGFIAATGRCPNCDAAESVKQEPVFSIERNGSGWAIYQGRDCFHHGYNLGHLTETDEATAKMLESRLNAEPVDAKAIRAEALEEAAKWCEQGTGDAVQTETLKLLLQERGRIASVIRGLK